MAQNKADQIRRDLKCYDGPKSIYKRIREYNKGQDYKMRSDILQQLQDQDKDRKRHEDDIMIVCSLCKTEECEKGQNYCHDCMTCAYCAMEQSTTLYNGRLCCLSCVTWFSRASKQQSRRTRKSRSRTMIKRCTGCGAHGILFQCKGRLVCSKCYKQNGSLLTRHTSCVKCGAPARLNGYVLQGSFYCRHCFQGG